MFSFEKDVTLNQIDGSSFETDLVAFCASMTSGRDHSHGEYHMTQVRENAKKIFQGLISQDLSAVPILEIQRNPIRVYKMVIAAAQFHDLADHKYQWTQQQQWLLEQTLLEHFSKADTGLIVDIMTAVSFSKERGYRMRRGDGFSLVDMTQQWEPCTRPIDFSHTLGRMGALVRDIVSDADKLEAIGKVGVERCVEYTKTHIREKESRQATREEIAQHLLEHAKEKLLILLTHNYIRTEVGKQLAAPLQTEMVDEICPYLSQKEARTLRMEYAPETLQPLEPIPLVPGGEGEELYGLIDHFIRDAAEEKEPEDWCNPAYLKSQYSRGWRVDLEFSEHINPIPLMGGGFSVKTVSRIKKGQVIRVMRLDQNLVTLDDRDTVSAFYESMGGYPELAKYLETYSIVTRDHQGEWVTVCPFPPNHTGDHLRQRSRTRGKSDFNVGLQPVMGSRVSMPGGDPLEEQLVGFNLVALCDIEPHRELSIGLNGLTQQDQTTFDSQPPATGYILLRSGQRECGLLAVPATTVS